MSDEKFAEEKKKVSVLKKAVRANQMKLKEQEDEISSLKVELASLRNPTNELAELQKELDLWRTAASFQSIQANQLKIKQQEEEIDLLKRELESTRTSRNALITELEILKVTSTSLPSLSLSSSLPSSSYSSSSSSSSSSPSSTSSLLPSINNTAQDVLLQARHPESQVIFLERKLKEVNAQLKLVNADREKLYSDLSHLQAEKEANLMRQKEEARARERADFDTMACELEARQARRSVRLPAKVALLGSRSKFLCCSHAVLTAYAYVANRHEAGSWETFKTVLIDMEVRRRLTSLLINSTFFLRLPVFYCPVARCFSL
jgi:hypothetical protein